MFFQKLLLNDENIVSGDFVTLFSPIFWNKKLVEKSVTKSHIERVECEGFSVAYK